MLRLTALALCLVLPAAHAASLKDYELGEMLNKVARESSQGTPRAINEDILDQGYTVDGNQLINHLSVRASHAERMRANPDSTRSQLGDSVCSNTGYRQLLARGAILTYSFTEYKTNRPVATERFDAGSCKIKLQKN
ncbi:quorum-sensing-regulated virulence factor family protein [Pseudomonas schmalbachii]|uniref:Quorum-sensing-regulated virulence factor family protein n=1 Tax=Pseudomonas schmalbachii TaxID=2816993 RepID=A0ABS3TLF7_9PSED|nr:quorum-sensing-regulated virulence factor family protein [Pseudomonas schmalbachii]MBO3274496.1 quorum-sensing-regulated virulence factor family protein [Pseudomonas schmalbachii]